MRQVLTGSIDYKVSYEQINFGVCKITVTISGGCLSNPIVGNSYVWINKPDVLEREVVHGLSYAYANAFDGLKLALAKDNLRTVLYDILNVKESIIEDSMAEE